MKAAKQLPALLQEAAAVGLNALMELAEQAEDPGLRFRAAKELRDSYWGRPRDAPEKSPEDAADAEENVDEELGKILALGNK